MMFLLSGCAAPSLQAWGERYQWDYSNINSLPLSLQALSNQRASTHYQASTHHQQSPPQHRTLHIYIEGDGVPFLNTLTVSPDPTPHDPMALRLMAQDSAPSVFLARPCYFQQQSYFQQQKAFEQKSTCHPSLWTVARYSPIVVQSLSHGVELLAKHYDQVVLIGYSGGGTLAILIAARVPKVSRVITLAGNLDTERWTHHHALTPLYDSLNPSAEPPLPEHVRQIHYVGDRDKNILPQWALDFAQYQPHVIVKHISHFDHQCCWEADWKSLLVQALETEAKAEVHPDNLQ